MSADSNYFILRHYKLRPTEKEKRLQFLQDTVSSLRQYKPSTPGKQFAVRRLIKAYTYMIEKIGEYHE